MKKGKNKITNFLISTTLFISSPALAKTKIEIDNDTASFKNTELISGAVKVSVSYNKQEDFADNSNNLQYQIFYNQIPKLNSSAYTRFIGSVSLKDLDNNGNSEVIVKTFSGGAHCCTDITI